MSLWRLKKKLSWHGIRKKDLHVDKEVFNRKQAAGTLRFHIKGSHHWSPKVPYASQHPCKWCSKVTIKQKSQTVRLPSISQLKNCRWTLKYRLHNGVAGRIWNKINVSTRGTQEDLIFTKIQGGAIRILLKGLSPISNQERKYKIEQDSPKCRNTVTLWHTGLVYLSPEDTTEH